MLDDTVKHAAMTACKNAFMRTTFSERLQRAMRLAGKNQAALAKELGISPQALSQVLSGQTKAMTAENTAKAAAALSVPTDWLATGEGEIEIEPTAGPLALRSPGARYLIAKGHPVQEWSNAKDLPDNEFAIVERKRVKLSAGDGKVLFEEEPLPPLAFRAQWLRSRGVTRRDRLVLVYAEGDSMEPALLDGDAVLCDMGQVEVHDGDVYAIDYGGELKVKRLSKTFNGGLRIISDNAAKYPPETLSEEQAHSIRVLGRVLWRGGSL